VTFCFPDVERSDAEKGPGESAWRFLVRSSWPESEAVRRDLERWLNEYTDEDRARLLSRLSSGVDAVSRSAHSELILHAILRRLAGTVVVEPATPTGGLTDFQVPDVGLDFEVYRPTTSRDRTAVEQRIGDIVAGLRKESNADFWLAVSAEAPGPQPPGLMPIRNDIRRWLATLDWAAARAALDAGQYQAPERVWEDPAGGWRVEVHAWPRANAARGIGPAVGIEEIDPFLPGIDALRARLLDKLRQHHGLERPLVLVADLSAAVFIHDDEIEDALYGMTVLDTTHNPHQEYRRRADSVWPHQTSTRPAAVLVIQRLHWGTARHARLTWMVPPGSRTCPLPGPWETAWLSDDDQVHHAPAAGETAALIDMNPLRD